MEATNVQNTKTTTSQASCLELDSSILKLVLEPKTKQFLESLGAGKPTKIKPLDANTAVGTNRPAELCFKPDLMPVMAILDRTLKAHKEHQPQGSPTIASAAIHALSQSEEIQGPLLVGVQGKYSAVFVGTKDTKQAWGVLFVFEGTKLSLFSQGYFNLTDRHPCAGKAGRIIYSNGDFYDGEMSPSPAGVVAPDATVKSAEDWPPQFVPTKHGHGSYHNLSKQSVYVGSFSDDLPEGQGTESYKDGSQYVGVFHKGKKHGYGEFSLTQMGLSYKGNFSQGFFFGKGQLRLEQQNVVVEGEWSGHKGSQIVGTIRYIESGSFYEGHIDGIKLIPSGAGVYTDKNRVLKGNFDDEGRIDGEVAVSHLSSDENKIVKGKPASHKERLAIYVKGSFSKWVEMNHPARIKSPNMDPSPKVIRSDQQTYSPGKLDGSTAGMLHPTSSQQSKPDTKSSCLWCCSRK